MKIESIKHNKFYSQYLKHISKFDEIYKIFLYELEHSHIDSLMKFCAVHQNKCIQEYTKDKKSIAFFCPTKSFRSNFGTLPKRLEAEGFSVLYFYGEIHDDNFENQAGSFYVSDMNLEKERLEFIDCILTFNAMDCLPDNPIKILVEHFSFVLFAPSLKKEQDSDGTYENFIDLYGFRPAFIPLYDYQFIPSKFVLEECIKESSFHGYLDLNNKNQERLINNFLDNVHRKIILDKLFPRRVVNQITLVHTGYSKIDKYVKNNLKIEPEKIIVYAPTPNDERNKKVWLSLMSINNYGSEIIDSLCKNFPEYMIVFKPYVDENQNVVNRIVKANDHYPNFRFTNDENTMELYSKAKIMVSDLSSTAFTFSLSTLRPTIFYSPNEHLIGTTIVDNGNYLKNRENIGTIATTLDALVTEVKKTIYNMDAIGRQIKQVRDEYLYNINHSEEATFKSIVEIVRGKNISCEHTVLHKVHG